MGQLLFIFTILLVLVLPGCRSAENYQGSISGFDEGTVAEVSQSVTNPVADPKEATKGSPTGDQTAAKPKEWRASESGLISQEAVIDGDTFLLQGKTFRLFGIDALEKAQNCNVKGAEVPCGQIARYALIGFVAGIEVKCDPIRMDRYGRYVSRCWAGNFDLSAGMVGAGLAVAYRRNLHGYKAQQDHAKAQRRGMWKGRFVQPWVWRAKRDQ